MAKLEVLSLNKEVTGAVELSEEISNMPYKPYIIKEAVVHYLAKIRQGTHATKGRSQVSGSTRKPWKQKGTGRARAGSVKSPIWRQGGVVFGPTPRSHSKSINKKVIKQALKSAIAEKIRNKQVIVVDNLDLENHKTKNFSKTLDNLECSKSLIVVDSISKNLALASQNLATVEVIHFRSLNVYKVLKYEKVIFVRNALLSVEKRISS